MIKLVPSFGLTRSAIVVLGVLVFCAAGLVVFSPRLLRPLRAQMWTIRLLRWEVDGVVAMIGALGGLV